MEYPEGLSVNSNTTFVKVKFFTKRNYINNLTYSNTTFVKVKLLLMLPLPMALKNSNTTFVKVKYNLIDNGRFNEIPIQIQHLLKLN